MVSYLRQLPRHKRHPPTQPPIHSPRLRINITRLLTCKKQHRPRNLIRLPPSPQRIQLPNLRLTAPLPRRIVRNLCHARLDQARTNRITTYTRAHELVRTRLHEGNDRCFGRRVIGWPGVGFQARDGRGGDDTSARIRFLRRCLAHSYAAVLGREKHAQCIRTQNIHEAIAIFLPEYFSGTYTCVREEDVELSVCVNGFLHDGRDGGLGGGVEDACVDGHVGVQGGEFARVQVEVRGGEVADVDCARAVAGELVGGCAADADGRVCAGYDYDFVFDASTRC